MQTSPYQANQFFVQRIEKSCWVHDPGGKARSERVCATVLRKFWRAAAPDLEQWKRSDGFIRSQSNWRSLGKCEKRDDGIPRSRSIQLHVRRAEHEEAWLERKRSGVVLFWLRRQTAARSSAPRGSSKPWCGRHRNAVKTCSESRSVTRTRTKQLGIHGRRREHQQLRGPLQLAPTSLALLSC